MPAIPKNIVGSSLFLSITTALPLENLDDLKRLAALVSSPLNFIANRSRPIQETTGMTWLSLWTSTPGPFAERAVLSALCHWRRRETRCERASNPRTPSNPDIFLPNPERVRGTRSYRALYCTAAKICTHKPMCIPSCLTVPSRPAQSSLCSLLLIQHANIRIHVHLATVLILNYPSLLNPATNSSASSSPSYSPPQTSAQRTSSSP